MRLIEVVLGASTFIRIGLVGVEDLMFMAMLLKQ